ncbi:hypothetical protein CCMA1212_009011 [Trichoderma ghanense]|uniref:Uncharacterized protein n=1 Tax=Trichoderma ghanense TaxID=65468 RepID=A0ABY2GUC9_9HYPO
MPFLLLSGLDLGAGGEQVLGVNADRLGSLLSETERGEGEGLDAVRLDAATGVDNQVVVLHDGVNVVGIAVARDQAGVEDLQTTVHHPSTSSTLGVAGKVLLEDTEDGVALASAEVAQLLADGRGLVLVVGARRRAVERGHLEVVNGEAPGCEGSSERSDAGVVLPEVVAHASEELLFLSDSLLLDVQDALLGVLLLVKVTALGLHCVNLIMKELQLGLLPLLDLLLATLNLPAAVVDVKQGRRELAGMLSRGGENALARSRDGSSNLVGGGGGKGKDTVDRDAHIQGQLSSHDDLDTASLRLHEAVSRRGGGARHFGGVVEATDQTDAGLALKNRLHTNVNRLDSGSASTDGSLDRSRRGEQQHVDPGRHRVDERLLQDVVLQRLVEESRLVHATQSLGTTHTGADNVTDLGDVNVLVELVRVGDTRRQQGLGNRHEEEQGDGVHLADDVFGNTISLGIPAGRDLTSDQSVEAQSLGDPERGALLHPDNVLSTLGDLKDLHLVAMLASELLSRLLGGLERLKVLLDDDLVEQLLLVGVVSVEELRLDQTDTRVLQDVLLVLLLDILVVDGLASLGVDPAGVRLALEGAVVVLDEAHDPGHLDAAFKRKLAIGLHLPSGSGVAPGADFGKSSHDDDLVQVDHALQLLVERSHLRLPVRKAGEVALDVGTRLDGLLLVKNLGVGTVDNGVLDGALLGDGPADLARLHDVLAELGHGFVQVGDELQAAVQVGKDRLGLAEVNDRSHAKGLHALCDHVVAGHETSATSPSDDSTADGEVVAPVLGVPSVEEGLESQLGLGVETIVTEGAVVGGQRENDLSGTGLETALSLLRLDAAEHADEVGEHDAVSQLRLGVDVVNLSAILGNGGEGDDVVEIPAKAVLGVVDVVDEGLHVLLASLVEGHHDDLRAARTEAAVHGLVVLGDLSRESTGGDDDLGTSADEALQNLGTNGAGTGTRHQDVLVLERDTVLGSLLKAVEVDGPLEARLSALAVLLGDDLALVHGQGAQNITVQALDLELRSLGHLVLLLDQLVDALQIVLHLGAVAILGDLAALGHLLNIVLELPAAGAGNFLVVEVAAGVHGGARTSGDGNVLVSRRQVQNLLAVLNELLSELLGKLVGLATLSGAVVDVVLHELEELGVGLVHDADALADNLTVDRLESAEDDVVSALVLGESVNGSGIHHHASRTSLGATRSGRRRQADTGTCGVFLGNSIEVCLGVTIVSKTSRRLHGQGQQQYSVLPAGTEAPSCLQVFPCHGYVEATRHLGGDEPGDEGLCVLAKVAIEGGLHGRTELVERRIFGFLRRCAEFLSKVTENLILEECAQCRQPAQADQEPGLQAQRWEPEQQQLGQQQPQERRQRPGRRGQQMRPPQVRVRLRQGRHRTEDLSLDRFCGIVGLVLGGQCALGHDSKGVCGADFDDALGVSLCQEDILGLNPPHGRGELVCQKLDEERVGELLLDFGTHDGGGGGGGGASWEGGKRGRLLLLLD